MHKPNVNVLYTNRQSPCLHKVTLPGCGFEVLQPILPTSLEIFWVNYFYPMKTCDNIERYKPTFGNWPDESLSFCAKTFNKKITVKPPVKTNFLTL